jgi:ligand-binding sensor domain-containing protein/signal transduction histidine kinase
MHLPVNATKINLSAWQYFRVAALVCMLADSVSAETQLHSNDYLVTEWQTSDGLPENLVSSFAQTRDGYLWVGTFGGLARFDGLRFVTFGVYNSDAFFNDRIKTLYQDHNGDLWIGIDYGGLIQFHAGKFTRYTAQQGLRSEFVVGTAEDSLGNFWVGGNGGLDRWENGKFVIDECGKKLEGQEVRSIHAGMAGRVWVTTSSGVYLIQNGKLEPYSIPGSITSLGQIGNVQEDSTGHLWVFGPDFATRFKLNDRSKKQTVAEPFFHDGVVSFCEGSNGDFWFGTWQHGLYHWCEGQGKNFDHINGITDSQIQAVYQDREQNVWVGTTARGLYRVRPQTIEIHSIVGEQRDPDTLTVVEDSAKRLWVGTYRAGLLASAAGSYDSFSQQPGPYDSSSIWSLCPARDGSLWVGTWDNGLFRIRDGQVSSFDRRNGLSDNAVQSIYEDNDGSLWIGTFSGGLNHFDGRTFTNYGAKDGLDAAYVTCILRTRDGTLWVGTDGWGVYRSVGGKFICYTKKAGLSSNAVLALYEDKEGHLWVGTQGDGGLSCWNGDNFVSMTRQSGLPADAIKEILDDDFGNLWLGSNRGILRADKGELSDFVEGKISKLHIVTYGSRDGLINIECRGGTQPAACKASDGKLWFATHEGLVMIDPRKIISNRRPPQVIIEEVLIGGRSVWSFDQRATQHLSGSRSGAYDVQLSTSDQGCEIQYTSPSLAAPEKEQFKYRMEGLDADWTEAGTERTAVYKYLPPGKYRFTVFACSENGVWSETPASVTLYRPPPFWQAWWFLVSCGLFMALAVSLIVRWFTRRRMKRRLEEIQRQHMLERERTRIASDIHDELGSSLTKISKLSEIMDQPSMAHEESRSYVKTIADTSNEAIRTIDEIIWAVNPKNDTLNGVADYLTHFAEEFLRPTRIACQLEIPLTLPHLPVSAEIRHNLFMAVKESLNNAVKHASPKRVRISLELTGNVLTIEVADDGRGFDPSANGSHGTGLTSMRKRMNTIGGEFQISSQPGQGTSIRIKVHVDNEIVTS